MAYDFVSESIASDRSSIDYDYCRTRALELIAEEIKRNNVEGSIAEAGVALGDYSQLINQVFSDRTLYLYDTFEGFSENDKENEIKKEYTSKEWFDEIEMDYFVLHGAEENMHIVRSKMKHLDNCVFRKGYFPESAKDEREEIFAFVSIDMDLYEPIFAALTFFYPRLSNGGYIFLHDYNHVEFLGVKQAIDDFENMHGRIIKVPLPDQGGTLVITKVNQ
jgi:O-methyltransferase